MIGENVSFSTVCIHIVTCQAHPALVKRVQQSVRIFQFLVFYHQVNLVQRIPDPCLVAAWSQDGLLETSLARDNILIYNIPIYNTAQCILRIFLGSRKDFFCTARYKNKNEIAMHYHSRISLQIGVRGQPLIILWGGVRIEKKKWSEYL